MISVGISHLDSLIRCITLSHWILSLKVNYFIYYLPKYELNTFIVVTASAPDQPLSPIEELQETFRNKNMLFPKTSLQLTRVIGQGIYAMSKT